MGNRIKELRKQRGFTLLQLAEQLGVSESTVQRYESGNIKNLKYETMVDLANILACSPAYLMGWIDNDTDHLDELEQKILEVYRILPDSKKIALYEFVKSLIE